jgi:hypothetical protein
MTDGEVAARLTVLEGEMRPMRQTWAIAQSSPELIAEFCNARF